MTIINEFTKRGFRTTISLKDGFDVYDEKSFKKLFYDRVVKPTIMKSKEESIVLHVKDYDLDWGGTIHFMEWELEKKLKPKYYYMKYVILAKKLKRDLGIK